MTTQTNKNTETSIMLSFYRIDRGFQLHTIHFTFCYKIKLITVPIPD